MPDIQQYSVSIKFKSEGSEKVSKDIDKVKNSTDNMKKSSKSIDSIGLSLGKLGGIATSVAGMITSVINVQTFSRLGSKMLDLSKQTSDYIETVNLFRASMGAAADQAQEFIDKAEDKLGLDPEQMMQSISSFYNLADGLGIANDRAYKMSQNLTQLAGDLSSFANISFDAAQQKLMSGFSGQVKPLREYGIALDQASLQETAYSLGLDQKVKNMTRAQKTELIYYQIMKSTQKMQGDLSRTLISPANALRVMQTEYKKLARAVGSIFIPMMMKIIPVVRMVTKYLTSAAQAIASFFGFKMSNFNADLSNVGNLLEGVSDGIDDVGDSADDTAKKMNKMLMPFDELNNLTTNTSSGSGSGTSVGVGGSLGIDLPEYDMFQGDGLAGMIEKSDWSGIAKAMAKKINEGLSLIPWDDIKKNVGKFAEDITKSFNVGIASTDWTLVGSSIAEGINTAIEFVYKFMENFDFARTGSALGKTLTGLFGTINWKEVGTILVDGVTGALDFMGAAMRDFDTGKILKAILDIVSRIKWFTIAKDIFRNILIGFYKLNPIGIIARYIIKGIGAIYDGIRSKFQSIGLDFLPELDFNIEDWISNILGDGSKLLDDFDKQAEEVTKDLENNGESMGKNAEKVAESFDKTSESIEKGFLNSLMSSKQSMLETRDHLGILSDDLEKKLAESIEKGGETTRKFLDSINTDVRTKLGEAAKAAEESGKNTGDNYASGFKSSYIGSALDNAQKKVKEALDKGKESKNWGSSVSSNYDKGIASNNKSIMSTVTSVQDKIKNGLSNYNTSYTWGSDMIKGFRDGMNKTANSENGLMGVVKNVSNLIKSYFHFSKPDLGPLRDYETWMPDMIKGLSSTMLDSMPILDKTLSRVSGEIANRMNEIDISQAYKKLSFSDIETNVMAEIRAKTSTANQGSAANTLASATYSAVSRALEQNNNNANPQQIIVNVGDKEIYRGYGKYQDERSNMLGVTT